MRGKATFACRLLERLEDLCAESLAYGFDDFHSALEQYQGFFADSPVARKHQLSTAFLRKSVELYLQRAFVISWRKRFVPRARLANPYAVQAFAARMRIAMQGCAERMRLFPPVFSCDSRGTC